jgi:hypothetical protein
MSPFRRWISGKELMERWKVGRVDLIGYILESKLTAYDNKSNKPYDISNIQDYIKEDEIVAHNISVDRYGDFDFQHDQHVFIEGKVVYFIFKYEDVINLEETIKKYKESEPTKTQKDRENYRAIATDNWKKNPQITIEEMVSMLLTGQISIEREKPYNPKTIRGWINTLAPNRKPGRRPKQKS